MPRCSPAHLAALQDALGRWHDCQVLDQAAERLAHLGEVHFVFAGYGFYEPLIQETAARLPNILLLPPQPRHTMLCWYRLADLSLVPFIDKPVLRANSPAKFFDSLAAGTPVVVTNAGWTKAFVEEHRCGWYAPPSDPAALASRIEWLFDHPSERTDAGQRGAAIARDQFDRAPDKELRLNVRAGNLPTPMVAFMSLDTAYFRPLELSDAMPDMNWVTSGKEITWILRDAATGAENMDIHWDFKTGDVVKLRFFNKPRTFHPMNHPIHIHGQRFLVVDRDGVPQENLAWKDTALLPVGSTMDLLVEMSNPGDWMLHCHIAEHLHAGMHFHFTVEGEGPPGRGVGAFRGVPPHPGDLALLDEVCDRFEAAWRNGETPQIEQYLADAANGQVRQSEQPWPVGQHQHQPYPGLVGEKCMGGSRYAGGPPGRSGLGRRLRPQLGRKVRSMDRLYGAHLRGQRFRDLSVDHAVGQVPGVAGARVRRMVMDSPFQVIHTVLYCRSAAP